MFMLVWCPSRSARPPAEIPLHAPSHHLHRQAATMAVVRVASSKPRLWFTYRRGTLDLRQRPDEFAGWRSPEMAKFCKERCVCAPQPPAQARRWGQKRRAPCGRPMLAVVQCHVRDPAKVKDGTPASAVPGHGAQARDSKQALKRPDNPDRTTQARGDNPSISSPKLPP